MRCCENCFVNEKLRERIRANEEKGACEFCDSTDVFMIDASALYKDFAVLLGLYEPVQYGEHFHPDMNIEAIDVGEQLAKAIQDDWGDIFNSDKLDAVKQCALLDEIRYASCHYDYKNPPISSDDLWASKDKRLFHVSEYELWNIFCNHIMHDRRFIIKVNDRQYPNADPKDWLPIYLSEIEIYPPVDTEIFRARINPRDNIDAPLDADKMGAPPCVIISGGRVNPPGIPVLYGALEKTTAVAEVRPEKGAIVTVASFMAKRPLRLVDLTTALTIPDPFSFSEENLSFTIRRNDFLRCLNTALSIPVRKEDADIEYVPTQYVAEVIKDAGYDGILYVSSLAPRGKNVVVFDPEMLVVNAPTKRVKITDVSVLFKEM